MTWPEFKTQEAFHEAVSEGMRGNWTEVDGVWKVVNDTSELEAKSTALDNERTAHKATKAEHKTALKAANDRASTAEAKLTAAEGEGGTLTDERLKKIREQVKSDLDGEYADVITERDTLLTTVTERDGTIRSLQLDGQVKKSMGENGVRADCVEDLFTLYGGEFDLTDDGKVKVANHAGKTPDVFISDDLKKRRPEFFTGTKAGGGGGGGAHETGAITTGQPTAEQILANPTQAMQHAHDNAE